MLTTGHPAVLAARVLGSPGAQFSGSLEVTRLDGLYVFGSDASNVGQSFCLSQEGVRDLRIDLGLLPLNAGIYRVEMKATSQGAAVARHSVLFEVRNPRPHRGGRPVLVYPASVSATPLNE